MGDSTRKKRCNGEKLAELSKLGYGTMAVLIEMTTLLSVDSRKFQRI
jgi:hypothetical protein